MDAGKETPTKAEGQGGGTRRPAPDYPAGGDSAESNADPKRVKTATGQWPDRLHNFHLRVDEALQKAKETMLENSRELKRSNSKDGLATTATTPPPVPEVEEAPSSRSRWAANTRNSWTAYQVS